MSAPAITVRMERVEERESGETYVYGVVRATAAPGEVNSVVLEFSRAGAGPAAVTLTDETTPVEAGERCERLDPNRVRCAPGEEIQNGITSVWLELGDRNDRAKYELAEGLYIYSSISGGTGADDLSGPAGSLDGNEGNDTLTGSDVARDLGEGLYGGPGDDRLDGLDGGDYLDGGPGDDVLLGRAGNDHLYAGAAADETAPAGNDRLEGGPGNDTLSDEDIVGKSVSVGPDTVMGGEGIDGVHSYILRSEPVRVDLRRSGPHGEAGENDTIEGVESVNGGDGDDVLVATDADAYIDGARGNDLVAGRAGDDRLLGGLGNDWVNGGAGNDRVEGSSGADVLAGGEGNDSLVDGDSPTAPDRDTLNGGDGADGVFSYGSRAAAVRVDLRGGAGQGQAGENDLIEKFEHATGGAGDDVLIGNDATNFLVAGRGDDLVNGRAGDDGIDGGRHRDTLRGGKGNDIFARSSDNARDYHRCDRDHDFVAASDARDVMRGSCEAAGWATIPMYQVAWNEANRITIAPRIGQSVRRAFFKAICIEDDGCKSVLELRTPTTRRLLGRKRFDIPEQSRERETIPVRLNDRGERRVRRGRYVRVVIRTRCSLGCGADGTTSTGFTVHMSR